MKHIFSILFTSLLIVSCGSTKNTKSQTQPETPVAVIEETETTQEAPVTPETPQAPTPVIEEKAEEQPIEVIEEPIATETVITETDQNDTFAFDHSALNGILENNVSPQGNVNYANIKKNWKILRDYIASLGTTMPDDTWSKEEKLAYWMNAYNAMTIDLILRNYPLISIKDIKNPWGQRFWKLGEKWYNLEEIEHQILRKMGDPRIHFGINCASFSCPPIPSEAFTSDKVDNQLEILARQFVNDTARNTISTDRVVISKIFTWFKGDFTENGSIVDFLNKYSDKDISSNAKVRYMEYNWSLNK